MLASHLALVALLAALSPATSLAVQPPSTRWPEYQFNPENNAVFEGAQTYHWQRRTGGRVNGALTYIDGTLYVESFDHNVYALDSATGKTIWATDVGGVIMNAPITANDVIVVGSGTSHIMADDMQKLLIAAPGGDNIVALDRRSGKILWKYRTIGEDMPTGVIVDNGSPAFIFSNGSGDLIALDLYRGTPLWKQRIPGAAAMSSLTMDAQLVFGSSHFSASFAFGKGSTATDRAEDSWTWAARMSDGQLQWIAPYGTGDCSPTLGDGVILEEKPLKVSAGMWRDQVDGLDEKTGRRLWEFIGEAGSFDAQGSAEGSIAGVFHDHTFFESLQFNRAVAAFDSRTGRLRWRLATRGAVKMSPIVARGHVYFGDTSGAFYVADEATGKVISRLSFADIFTCSPPIIVGNTLFVASDAVVHALPLDQLDSGKIAP